MTPDLIGILSVGIALAALIVGATIRLSGRMDRLEAQQAAFGAELAALGANRGIGSAGDVAADAIGSLDTRLRQWRHRLPVCRRRSRR